MSQRLERCRQAGKGHAVSERPRFALHQRDGVLPVVANLIMIGQSIMVDDQSIVCHPLSTVRANVTTQGGRD